MSTEVKSPPPDPQIGQASREAIELANRQFEAQQALLGEFSPLFKEQIQFSLDQQQKYADRADQSFEDYQTYFRPLEQQLSQTAADYNTADRRNQAAADAEAAVAGQFANARQSLTEDLNAQGASGGGRGLALRNAMAIEEAKARAGAGDSARRNVENTGLQLLTSATNFGRGFPGQGIQLGQMAAGSGGAAQGSVSGLSGLTGAGYSQALQGYGVGINGLTGLNQLQQNRAQENAGMFGDLLGAGASIAGMFFRSSKKIKTKGAPVNAKKALAGLSDLKVDHWTYKPGMGDEREHVGPYAEDVQKAFGDQVAPGGKAINMVAMSKVNADAIRQLSQQIARMEREVQQLEAS